MRVIDRTGERYGRLVVIERLPAKSKTDGNARWFCRCDCGKGAVVYGQDLARGRTLSCGCLQTERRFQHGKADSPTYAIWQMMLQRCENPTNKSYPNYGGRGIFVCDEWHDFAKFYADMGDRPDGLSLERKENSGPYVKWNCIWASITDQNNNTRRNRLIEFRGETKTIAQWAEITGLEWTTIRSRLDHYGWDVEHALTVSPTGAVVYEFNGHRRTMEEWSVATGIHIDTLRSRINKLGWTIEQALGRPALRKKER